MPNKFNLWVKALNHYLITFQKLILKNEFVLGVPEYVMIDTTNTCNLHCPLCPTGQGRNEYPKGMMKLETFKKVIDESGKRLYDIYMGNWGEPLLNPEIYEMIKYAHKYNIRISINTNLNTLDKDSAKKLVESKPEALFVSIDGASQTSYEKYRKGGDFNKVIDNIKLISEIKKQRNSNLPVIVWQFLVMKHNEVEIDRASEMAKKLGIQFELKYVRCDMGREVFMSDKEKFENAGQWLPGDEQYSRYDYKLGTRRNRKSSCWFLWDFAVINWDGGVAPCCAVYREEDILGSIENTSFKSIWNNAKYKAAREAVRTGQVGEVQTVCENCIKNGFID